MPDNTTWSGPSLEDYVTQAQNSFTPQEFWSPGGGGDSADEGHSIFSQFDPLQSAQTYLSDRQAARPWWNEGYDFLSRSLNNNGAAEKFANDIGYTGNVRTSLPTGMDTMYGESDTINTPTHALDPSFLDQLHNYNFSTGTEHGNPFLYASDKSGKQIGGYQTGTHDNLFDKFVSTMIPMVVGAGFGAGVGGAVGGTAGQVAGGATQGAITSGAQGGDVLKGAVTGGIGGGLGAVTSTYNPAGMAGIENPTLAGMFNKGVGSAAGTVVRGGSGSDALKSGIGGAMTAGLNSIGGNVGNYFKDAFSQFSTPSSMESMYDLPGNMVTPSGFEDNAPEQLYSDEGGRFGSFDVGGKTYDSPQQYFQGASPNLAGAPNQQIASFSAPSFSNVANNVGNFIGNNAGDLASMLYGFYNNKKQQHALQQQIGGLQGLYGQNSPYAQQLRAKLQAQAAQRGTRLNTGGREVQLQAALADRAASMAPAMYQMQQGQNALQNNKMNMILQGVNKMGGFKALGDLFQPQASLTGPGSMDAYGRLDDMYSSLG